MSEISIVDDHDRVYSYTFILDKRMITSKLFSKGSRSYLQ